MANRKRRTFKKWILLSGVALLIALLCIGAFFFFGKEKPVSIQNDSAVYENEGITVFYPDCTVGLEKAKEVAKGKEKGDVYDYALVPYGDYKRVVYRDGTSYFLDRDGNEFSITSWNEEALFIVSDSFRYEMKKAEIDAAYTYDFLISTAEDTFDQNIFVWEMKSDGLSVFLPEYDYAITIPYAYLQNALDIDMGYESKEYVHRHYISKERKKICFTFDDGPDLSGKTTGQIVDTLSSLDCSATFFVLGNRLGEKQIAFCQESVQKGMEIGSHTQSHPYLTKISSEEAYTEIMTPYHDLNDGSYGFGYDMKVFRPPYGSHNTDIDGLTSLKAVLWNVDSRDWYFRTVMDSESCVETIVEKVKAESDENDVVLFHDIYQTSADAACELAASFVKEGYQILSVSELMETLEIENVTAFYGK